MIRGKLRIAVGIAVGLYYVSFAVVAWVDVFTRKDYRDIVIESLQHCQQEKGLIVYG